MPEFLSYRKVQKFLYPQKALRSTFLNIAPQNGKINPACKFLSNTNKCQDTAFCAGFSLNLGTSTPVVKVRHIFPL